MASKNTTPANKNGKKKNNNVNKAQESSILTEFKSHTEKYLLSNNRGNWGKFHHYYKDEGKKLRDLRFKKTPVVVDYIIYGFVILVKMLYSKDYSENTKIFEEISGTNATTPSKLDNNKAKITVILNKDGVLLKEIRSASVDTYGIFGKKEVETFQVIDTVIGEGNKTARATGRKDEYTVGLKNVKFGLSGNTITISYESPKTNDVKEILDRFEKELQELEIGKEKNSLTAENVKTYFTIKNLIGIGVIAFHKKDIKNKMDEVLNTPVLIPKK